ncbi:MAG: RNA polymerase factor sigma-54 [Desulfatirhabdiaceae bacterium]
MAFELRQQLKLSQQLIMTPQLQLAIKLLQLSRLELLDKIHQELMENPALEESVETTTDQQEVVASESFVSDQPADTAPLLSPAQSDRNVEDIDWSTYINEYSASGKYRLEVEQKESPNYEAFISRKESLNDHLMWQLRMSFLPKDEENIGGTILGNLNADGYLDISTDDLVLMTGESLEKTEKVLRFLQTFDPPGVCSRNLKECLLIQARILELNDTIIPDIIENHLNHLETKNYKAICKALKVEFQAVVAAVEIIRQMEPKPGGQFNVEEPHYITPDIYVYRMDNEFVIVLNDDGLPKLRLNSFFREATQKNQSISIVAREYVQEKMRSATWLIRSIHQRQKTIYRVMESILRFQRDFFENGIAYLKPMVLRDVADDIGMHESTISRVTTNKYAHTPQGIFELKFFFNSSINRKDGDVIASASVLSKIRQIIDSEDHSRPYSDQQLADILEESNIKLARRTVAKYREMLRILPSSKRKQF